MTLTREQIAVIATFLRLDEKKPLYITITSNPETGVCGGSAYGTIYTGSEEVRQTK